MKKRFHDFVLKIGLASDTVMRSWSSGEVKKAETINYKTGKPVIDGLFCERIFGPIKDYECQCGKYKHIRSKGKECERCNVLVTNRSIRRRRMGHIELDEPICHIWFYKSIPSKLSAFLSVPISELEEIIYFRSYAITKTKDSNKIPLGSLLDLRTKISILDEKNRQFILLQKILNDLLDEFSVDSQMYLQAQSYLDSLQTHEDDFLIEEFIEFVNDESNYYHFKTGGLAIEDLIKQVNIEKEIDLLKVKISKRNPTKKINEKVLKRLEILNTFKNTKQNPTWMLTRTIPVLPPELRPIVSLEGGRFAASGINALYIELLIRKNRLQKFKEKDAPLFMINELRNSVQEAVNSLFDNSLTTWNKSRNPRQIGQRKSIATNLKGKTGRFRQNLLGKRVDYSGGSVITGGPELKFNEFGLPRDIAIILFNVAILGRLMERGINKKSAEEMIDQRHPDVWEILEKVVKGYPMILNRAPTLHRLGIQAFFPKLIRGQAIMIHPLVTTAFNADFDGDRMPIHLPLTEKAKQEAIDILMSDKNILNPRNGKLIVMPSQDIILGIYYLTLEIKDQKGEGNIFSSFDHAMLAYWNGKISLHSLIFVSTSTLQKDNFSQEKQKLILTTVGKLIFNRTFIKEFAFLNSGKLNEKLPLFSNQDSLEEALKNHVICDPINKGELLIIINEFLNEFGFQKTVKLLDRVKDVGFKYATYSGMTISLFKVLEHKTTKKDLFDQTEKELDKIRRFYRIGAMTLNEKKSLKIKKWTKVKEKVEKQLKKYFDVLLLDQSVRFMVKSGARGSISNFTQFAGMRGLMINTQGRVIDTPIKSSLAEGLNVLEYYISTYGARKGMVDTALKTADSGYLTRRLVDAMHDVYTTEFDCQTKNYQVIKTIFGAMDSIIIPLPQRIFGRFSAEDLYDQDNNLIISKNEMITQKIARIIGEKNISEVKVRSILSCEVLRGVCCMCFGLDLAKNKVINKRQAVGVLSAQSIGEPATQLTMRTFHTGGVSDVADITQGLPRVIEIFDCVLPKGQNAFLSPVAGEIIAIELIKDLSYHITIKPLKRKEKIQIINIPSDFNLIVKLNQIINKGAPLTEGSINLKDFLKVSGDKNMISDYIISEVQKIYSLQGIEIADKYIEIVTSKMLSRARIIDSGDSHYVIGQTLELHILIDENRKLAKENQKEIIFEQIICGIKEIATKTHSFLSAASFQETTKVLIQAAIENRIDPLYGLKENVICGNLIPVGSGFFPKEDEQK